MRKVVAEKVISAILSPSYWRLKILGFYGGYVFCLLLALLGWPAVCHLRVLVACICLIPPVMLSGITGRVWRKLVVS
jgi:hypothetical protein